MRMTHTKVLTDKAKTSGRREGLRWWNQLAREGEHRIEGDSQISGLANSGHEITQPVP